MRYADLTNTTAEEIEAGAWNPYLGISIRNKYFTPGAIAAFTRWGAAHARHRFALLIVDIIQRVNNEVFERSAPDKAFEKALRQAEPIREHCLAAVAALPPELRAKVVVIEWADIMDETYACNRELVFNYFDTCPEFREYVLKSVSGNLGGIVSRLKEGNLETLSQYLLFELPELLFGFMHQGVHFNLCVYPGSLAFLARDLLGRDFFQPLVARMRPLPGPLAHAELYADE